MFGLYNNRRKDDQKLAQHLGVFRHEISLGGAIVFIVAGTIGAGVLGIPYAISKVGIIPGICYIIVIGFLMMGLNLLVAEIAVKTQKPLQIVGLAKEYLGKVGGWIMTVIVYGILFGVLVVYIIGEGASLAALFGGSNFWWSILFFVFGSFFVIKGLRMIKGIEVFLLIGLLIVILFIAWMSFGHISIDSFYHVDLSDILLPYGVVLFALHKSTTIAEAHSLLKNKDRLFKKAIVLSDLIVIALYIAFTVIVVGVTGQQTTEIATIGLGQKVGGGMLILGNIFAILAMATSFMTVGVSLRDSLRWDFKIKPLLSIVLVLGVPFLIFLLGLRQFIAALDIVGGVFVSLELLMILLIYWRFKHTAHVQSKIFHFHHAALVGVVLFVAFTVGAVYSVIKLF